MADRGRPGFRPPVPGKCRVLEAQDVWIWHISDLGQDYFQFDSHKHMLRGERSGARYQLSGRVRVKVVRVSLEQAKIDFVLVDKKNPSPRPSPKGEGDNANPKGKGEKHEAARRIPRRH